MRRRLLAAAAASGLTASLVLASCAALSDVLPTSAPSNGQLVSAAGVTQYVECEGPVTPEAPTVVLIGGLGSSSERSWRYVEPTVAKDARVCSVDRPGTGRSPDREVSSNGPVQNGHEILAALAAYGEPGPYLFVGWSYGGLVALTAAAEAQSGPGVEGVVLVDGSLPDEYRTVDKSGWVESDEPLDMAAAEPIIAGLRLGNIPVVVLEAGDQPYDEQTIAEMRNKDYALASKSEDFVYVEVPDSGHFISRDAPEAVIAAIEEALSAVPDGSSMGPCPAEFTSLGMVCLDGG